LSDIVKFSEERNIFVFQIIRLIGEIILSMDRAKIPEILLNTKLNKGIISLGGIVSSLLIIYDGIRFQYKNIQPNK
jgi:hypothetical protein